MIHHHRDAFVLYKIYVSFVKIIWLPLVDTFRTFYFNEFIGLKDKLEIIKSNFVFT
jgi:hypothetical protein